MGSRSVQALLPRHEAFLRREAVDRPLVGVWVGGYYPAEQFPHGHSHWRAEQPLEPAVVRFEPFREDYDDMYRVHREADDDFFYVGSAYWGIPWLESILGCALRVGQTSCWAEPWFAEPGDVRRLDFDLENNAWFQCLAEFTDELWRFADGRFPVCPPLLRGPGDAAAAICGAQRLVLALIEREAWAGELLERCAQIRQEVLRRLQQRMPAWFGTHAAGGYPSKLWTERTVSYYQDDFASLLNPRLFREFLLPLARRTKPASEVHFIHLHSSCLYMVDALLADDTFGVIEVNLDLPGAGPPLPEYLPVLQRVQQRGRPLLLWGEISSQDWTLLENELEPAGLSLQPIVKSPDEARRYRWHRRQDGS